MERGPEKNHRSIHGYGSPDLVCRDIGVAAYRAIFCLLSNIRATVSALMDRTRVFVLLGTSCLLPCTDYSFQ